MRANVKAIGNRRGISVADGSGNRGSSTSLGAAGSAPTAFEVKLMSSGYAEGGMIPTEFFVRRSQCGFAGTAMEQPAGGGGKLRRDYA